jgi:hypothetical protein
MEHRTALCVHGSIARRLTTDRVYRKQPKAQACVAPALTMRAYWRARRPQLTAICQGSHKHQHQGLVASCTYIQHSPRATFCTRRGRAGSLRGRRLHQKAAVEARSVSQTQPLATHQHANQTKLDRPQGTSIRWAAAAHAHGPRACRPPTPADSAEPTNCRVHFTTAPASAGAPGAVAAAARPGGAAPRTPQSCPRACRGA